MSAAALAEGDRRVALLGNPNCGKTALFNLLTGSRQKVANYAGVTVERKEGLATSPAGRRYRVLDLPGAYSLNADSADEEVTRDVILGHLKGEQLPEVLVCVTDATNLRLNLRLVLEVRRLGLPMLLALNMSDVAARRGIEIDLPQLSQRLGVPVVPTVGVHRGGADPLLAALDAMPATIPAPAPPWHPPTLAEITETHRQVREILRVCVREPEVDRRFDERIDRVVMHPQVGMAILAIVLFLMFQAVYAWAEAPMGWIEAGTAWLGEAVGATLADGPLRSLLVDGVIAGVGGVLVFLPQIVILFAFILALEDSGYLPRAAFLLDHAMGKVGLSGRSFIPLLSSFACAIPGIMATRVIANWRDRLATILIAPLMTCSARLPVYALLIGAFIPERTVAGVFNLQGLVLFALYLAGILGAVLVAFVLKRTVGRGLHHPLMMELPTWRLPNLRNLALGLLERVKIFIRRVGGIILSLTIIVWALATFPAPPADATGPAIDYSYAGMLGHAITPLFAPIGFGWEICIALIPGMAAREVAVGALGTVYALQGGDEAVAAQLGPIIAGQWSLATALSLLAWYVFAPQCLSTLAVVKRETQSWRYPLLMAGYLFAMAYLASLLTYQIARSLGAG
ncbi:MAG: ferrous iron transporter B [Xanthomonadales bacterium]|nr:Fe(2+) transporter FeoB [Xanthomonadales bacterium]MCC6593517.1 ferrous iron transporter B [Xanthomonadales bacterium]MCE7932358.1 ferrous iron transporter B [Xanthomonadales bacterium PRO6]